MGGMAHDDDLPMPDADDAQGGGDPIRVGPAWGEPPPLAATLLSLPHPARVAFAVRCVRGMLPLFDRLWPDAGPARAGALRTALALADRAAAEPGQGQGPGPLDEAALKAAGEAASAVAAAALRAMHGLVDEGDSAGPQGQEASQAVALIARAADWATRAARARRGRSIAPALGAFLLSRDAAREAGVPELPELRAEELETLARVAARGQWTDTTAVPPQVLDLLAGELPDA